ncbi:hypothetical protein DV515_00009269 [Chloebia gouldiae]|uniref:Uncharacterized protein n=3 Tax=Telluraves TaxID=3073808 RepID=A0A3L8SCA6_CHLGU|nr:hypothetical protein DV515_00009269 [Chloebia gouldiae]
MKHCPLPAGRTPDYEPFLQRPDFYFGHVLKYQLTKHFLLQLHNIVLMQQHSPSVLLPLRYFCYHGNDNIIWMGIRSPKVSLAGCTKCCQFLCQDAWPPHMAFTCGNDPHKNMGRYKGGEEWFLLAFAMEAGLIFPKNKCLLIGWLHKPWQPQVSLTSCNHPYDLRNAAYASYQAWVKGEYLSFSVTVTPSAVKYGLHGLMTFHSSIKVFRIPGVSKRNSMSQKNPTSAIIKKCKKIKEGAERYSYPSGPYGFYSRQMLKDEESQNGLDGKELRDLTVRENGYSTVLGSVLCVAVYLLGVLEHPTAQLIDFGSTLLPKGKLRNFGAPPGEVTDISSDLKDYNTSEYPRSSLCKMPQTDWTINGDTWLTLDPTRQSYRFDFNTPGRKTIEPPFHISWCTPQTALMNTIRLFGVAPIVWVLYEEYSYPPSEESSDSLYQTLVRYTSKTDQSEQQISRNPLLQEVDELGKTLVYLSLMQSPKSGGVDLHRQVLLLGEKNLKRFGAVHQCQKSVDDGNFGGGVQLPHGNYKMSSVIMKVPYFSSTSGISDNVLANSISPQIFYTDMARPCQLKKPQAGRSVIALGQGEKDCIFRQKKSVFVEGIKRADPEISPFTTAETRILETMKTRHPGSAVAREQWVGDISVLGYMEMIAFTDKSMTRCSQMMEVRDWAAGTQDQSRQCNPRLDLNCAQSQAAYTAAENLVVQVGKDLSKPRLVLLCGWGSWEQLARTLLRVHDAAQGPSFSGVLQSLNRAVLQNFDLSPHKKTTTTKIYHNEIYCPCGQFMEWIFGIATAIEVIADIVLGFLQSIGKETHLPDPGPDDLNRRWRRKDIDITSSSLFSLLKSKALCPVPCVCITNILKEKKLKKRTWHNKKRGMKRSTTTVWKASSEPHSYILTELNQNSGLNKEERRGEERRGEERRGEERRGEERRGEERRGEERRGEERRGEERRGEERRGEERRGEERRGEERRGEERRGEERRGEERRNLGHPHNSSVEKCRYHRRMFQIFRHVLEMGIDIDPGIKTQARLSSWTLNPNMPSRCSLCFIPLDGTDYPNCAPTSSAQHHQGRRFSPEVPLTGRPRSLTQAVPAGPFRPPGAVAAEEAKDYFIAFPDFCLAALSASLIDKLKEHMLARLCDELTIVQTSGLIGDYSELSVRSRKKVDQLDNGLSTNFSLHINVNRFLTASKFLGKPHYSVPLQTTEKPQKLENTSSGEDTSITRLSSTWTDTTSPKYEVFTKPQHTLVNQSKIQWKTKKHYLAISIGNISKGIGCIYYINGNMSHENPIFDGNKNSQEIPSVPLLLDIVASGESSLPAHRAAVTWRSLQLGKEQSSSDQHEKLFKAYFQRQYTKIPNPEDDSSVTKSPGVVHSNVPGCNSSYYAECICFYFGLIMNQIRVKLLTYMNIGGKSLVLLFQKDIGQQGNRDYFNNFTFIYIYDIGLRVFKPKECSVNSHYRSSTAFTCHSPGQAEGPGWHCPCEAAGPPREWRLRGESPALMVLSAARGSAAWDISSDIRQVNVMISENGPEIRWMCYRTIQLPKSITLVPFQKLCGMRCSHTGLVNTVQKMYTILQQKLEAILKYFTVALNIKMHLDEFSKNLGRSRKFLNWKLNVYVGVDVGRKQGGGTGTSHIWSFCDSDSVNVSRQS